MNPCVHVLRPEQPAEDRSGCEGCSPDLDAGQACRRCLSAQDIADASWPIIHGVHAPQGNADLDKELVEQVCAGVLTYECNGLLEDIALYKDDTLAVLSGDNTHQHTGRLAMLPCAAIARQPLPEAALQVGRPFTAAHALKPVRQRRP